MTTRNGSHCCGRKNAKLIFKFKAPRTSKINAISSTGVDGLEEGVLRLFKSRDADTSLLRICRTMSQSPQRLVPYQGPEAFDDADRERAVVLRRKTIAFIAFLATLTNTSLDWPRDSEDDREEVLAASVKSVVERIEEISKLLDECEGKLASDHYAQPLPYVLAETMCDAMKKFLDSKAIAVAALELISKM